jgi:ergothioneine biosynthesis protein EgtB
MNPNWHVDTETLADRLRRTRRFTEQLCEPLETEDYVVQSMTEASPAKWHLAHSTWFFDAFIFEDLLDRDPIDDTYNFLFNSYYNAAGDQYARSDRGLLSRPTVDQVMTYRRTVDEQLDRLIDQPLTQSPLTRRLELGIHHEQQHQELLVTDIKHMFAQNPLRPAVYSCSDERGEHSAPDLEWHSIEAGNYNIGHTGDGFAYDSESPAHTVFVQDVAIANRPVTCGEYLEFMADDGYERVDLWHADGWQTCQRNGWDSPLYWTERDGEWHIYTLSGLRPVDPHETLAHISYYEAYAFTNWLRTEKFPHARLPTEAEWEVACRDAAVHQSDRPHRLVGHTAGTRQLHPTPARQTMGPTELYQPFGTVWEWTASAFEPYPGFEAWEGGIGEYNGKFMVNQYVLRGGSCATPPGHLRPTYRNFFYPDARWQFSGLRLARDAGNLHG